MTDTARECYVAMSGDDSAYAARVITGSDPQFVKEFLRRHRGAAIRRVSSEEAVRLLRNYGSGA